MQFRIKPIPLLKATPSVLLLLSINYAALAQTTSFTYQGSLIDNGSPANGLYDFHFRLFDSLTSGTQIGPDIQVSNWVVSNGNFSGQIDFGNQFPGANRFLDIGVRPSGGGSFRQLTPRQQLTSMPYGIRALTAGQSNAAVNSSALGGFSESSFIQNTTAAQPQTSFNISGNGTAGGTLSGNTLLAQTQFNLAGSRIISTAGSHNLAIGINAGAANTGSNNSFFGFNAGKFNTTGGNNSFFGTIAGESNTTGSSNSFFGNGAGYSNTTGSSNSFFGDAAGLFNTSGSFNSFFGRTAGADNTTGNFNVFIGWNSGSNNTTGGQNTFVGSATGGSNTSQSNNTFVGYSAGLVSGAGDSTNSASGNTFVGANSGLSNTTGGMNTFVGYNAASSNTTGRNNTFVAGGGNTTGSNNVFFGGGNSNTSGSNNVFLGRGAGANNTTGSNNTFIGAGAGNPDAATQVSNSIAIGAGALVSTSHTVVIGTPQDTTQLAANWTMSNLPVTGNMSLTGLLTAGTGGPLPALRMFRVDSSHSFVGVVADHLFFREFYGAASAGLLCYRDTGTNDGFAVTNCFSGTGPSTYKTSAQQFTAGLEIVNRLIPYSFNWKDNGQPDFGLNADEVAAIEQLLVTHTDKGEVHDVNTHALDAVFINAFKQQQEQIHGVRGRFDVLKQLFCENNPGSSFCN